MKLWKVNGEYALTVEDVTKEMMLTMLKKPLVTIGNVSETQKRVRDTAFYAQEIEELGIITIIDKDICKWANKTPGVKWP